ncbi:MAG: GNAT family N-acetyltransferase [Armatimonadota bacterium]
MIRGEKTILRAIEPSDVRQLWEWTQDEEIMRLRNFPVVPTSLAEAERDFEESLGQDPSLVRLAITTMDGKLIGEIALRNIDYRNGNADFTIAIGDRDYWGHGYGTDAIRALMQYAFEQLNLYRITLYVHAFNHRAIRAYEHCGFRHEGCLRRAQYLDGQRSDVLIMGLLREDFEEAERQRSHPDKEVMAGR